MAQYIKKCFNLWVRLNNIVTWIIRGYTCSWSAWVDTWGLVACSKLGGGNTTGSEMRRVKCIYAYIHNPIIPCESTSDILCLQTVTHLHEDEYTKAYVKSTYVCFRIVYCVIQSRNTTPILLSFFMSRASRSWACVPAGPRGPASSMFSLFSECFFCPRDFEGKIGISCPKECTRSPCPPEEVLQSSSATSGEQGLESVMRGFSVNMCDVH